VDGQAEAVTGLDEVVDDLYGGALDDFVARRDAAARAARAAKDRDLAGRIASLRKPTLAAWAVNRLVRDDPSLADALRDLGEGMREAERSLDGPALRELGTQRRALVSGLVAQARRLASAAGQKVSAAAAQEIDRTLTAALADPRVADAVGAGTLTHGTEYVGFGSGVPTSTGGDDDAPPARTPTRRTTTERPTAGRPRSGSAASTASADPTAERPRTTSPPVGRTADRERTNRERERLRQRHEQAVAAREAADAALDRARARHGDVATSERDAVAALEGAERESSEAYATEEELVRALADVRRRLAEARAALPRVDERLVAARARARDQEKAVRAARRDLDRAEAAAERARAQEQRTADASR